jgi:16S rRNA (guanine1516-N2)-methyltransferase
MLGDDACAGQYLLLDGVMKGKGVTIGESEQSCKWIMEWIEVDGISHRALRDLQNPKLKPLSVDFVSSAMNYRRNSNLRKKDPFARALGVPLKTQFVLDATAGLGIDAFIMASMGFRVLALERSPLVFELLADGYERLVKHAEISPGLLREIARRLKFENISAHQYLSRLSRLSPFLENLETNDRPDIVYLDPMYPEQGRSKSALPKKGMQIFRKLIGDDSDASELVSLARACAREKVIVKRPTSAPDLDGKPGRVYEGKTARYDIYLPIGKDE